VRPRSSHPSPFLLAAVAPALSGIRVSAAADKCHDRHLTRPSLIPSHLTYADIGI
jgi:hypothetical protein